MSDFDAESYAAPWRKKNAEEEERIKRKAADAHEEAARLASLIAEKAGASRVVLFGSLAEGTVRTEDFDIDLAVYGGRWSDALQIAEESPFRVDVLWYEDAPEHLQKRIDQRGKQLFPCCSIEE